MTLEEFKVVISGKIKILPSKVKDTLDYQNLRILKEFTRYINFGCKWQVGKCAQGETTCCRTCGEEIGHLKFILEEDLLQYASLFMMEDGFLAKYGCKLLKHEQSALCLSNFCKSAQKNLVRSYVGYLREYGLVLHNLENNLISK